MLETEETTALVALSRLFGFTPTLGHALIRHFGSAVAVFEAPPERVREALGEGRDEAGQIGEPLLEWARKELDRISALLALHPGEIPVYLHIPEEKRTMIVPLDHWCDASPACLDRLMARWGEQNVRLTRGGGK